MYTNGFTKAPFQSLVVVTNAPKGYQVYTTTEFAAQSEHITLETDAAIGTHYTNDAVMCDEFSGFAEYAPQHHVACEPIGLGCIAGCEHFASR